MFKLNLMQSNRIHYTKQWQYQRKILQLTFIFAIVAFSPIARSQWSPGVDFSGFGTLGYSVLDNSTARYHVGLGKDGTTSSGSFLLDTRLALQADAKIVRFLTGTIQILGREDQQGDFDPRVEWAFLKYRISNIYAIRAGILSLPLFSLSDTREVGYATPYLRPPEDLYSQVPIRNLEGIDILADLSLGDWYITAQATAGVSEDKLTGDVQSHSSGAGVNTIAEYGSSQFRFSYFHANVYTESANLDQVRAGIAQTVPFVPGAADLLKDFERGTKENTSKADWVALGLAFDFDRYFIDAEYAFLNFDNWFQSTSSWYVASGYRVGNFTPYVYFSSTRQIGRPDPVDFPDTPELNALEDGIAIITKDPTQNTLALGLRWDFAPKFSVTLQVDRIHRKDRGISFRNFGSEVSQDDGKDVTVYNMTVDFVF